MRTLFLVNDPEELVQTQTTTLLIAAAVRRGHEAWISGVDGLSAVEGGALVADALAVDASAPEALIAQLGQLRAVPLALATCDLCVVRTNPGRDEGRHAHHGAALRLLESAEERGLVVINRPRGLVRSMTKLPLLELPRHLQPRTLVTATRAHIESFVREISGRVVVKPVLGSRGRHVFLVESVDALDVTETEQRIEAVLRQGYAMVQEFVPGAERGDLRVTLVNGEILRCGGQPAAIARVPKEGDFRSNLHVGGEAHPGVVNQHVAEAVELIAPRLASEGFVHVGADFVGGSILELNVFSPGGLYPSERLYGFDFSGKVIEAFEGYAARA